MTPVQVLTGIELTLEAANALLKAAAMLQEVGARLQKAHESGAEITPEELEGVRARRQQVGAQLDAFFGVGAPEG